MVEMVPYVIFVSFRTATKERLKGEVSKGEGIEEGLRGDKDIGYWLFNFLQ
jgi:hypothetical protein